VQQTAQEDRVGLCGAVRALGRWRQGWEVGAPRGGGGVDGGRRRLGLRVGLWATFKSQDERSWKGEASPRYKGGNKGGDAATSRCAAREGLGRGGSSAQRVAWHTLSQARQHGEGCTMMALPSSQSCMSWGPGRRGAPTAAWHRAQTCARGVRSRARGRRCLARSTPV
jgi:hypothetical protein